MRHLQPLLCQQNGKASAAGPAVKDRPDAVQVRQQFPLDMRLLHDIVNKGLLPFRFPFAFVRLIPHPFGDPGTVIHDWILPVAYSEAVPQTRTSASVNGPISPLSIR